MPGAVTIFAPRKLGVRDRKKKETRRLILKCANALFHERGHGATTTEDIVDRAGVTNRRYCAISARKRE